MFWSRDYSAWHFPASKQKYGSTMVLYLKTHMFLTHWLNYVKVLDLLTFKKLHRILDIVWNKNAFFSILAAKHLRNAMQMAKIFWFLCARVIHIASTKKWTELCTYVNMFGFHDVSQFKVRIVHQSVTTFRYTEFLLTWHVLATIHCFFCK